MGLLADIQTALLNEQPLGPILLKLRFLGARLGSATLEEWVKYEVEGYPPGVPVPEYRKFGVSYVGGFNGSFGRVVSNLPIPPYLIAQHAGERWLSVEERQNISALEHVISEGTKAGTNPGIEAANLVILLSDKIYRGLVCHSVRGVISIASLVDMMGVLRAKILELSIELEKNVPEAQDIAVGQALQPTEPEKAAVVTHITNQIINAPVGSNVANSGANAQFNIAIRQGDVTSLAKALQEGGIPDADASELAAIVASEKPEDTDQPFGRKAKEWITANIGKALNGTWKIGAAAATALLTEAAKHYYGLK